MLRTISAISLTAKCDRTWKALIPLRAQVGAVRFREMMAELPSTLSHIRQQR
jgi:hypothetical protein